MMDEVFDTDYEEFERDMLEEIDNELLQQFREEEYE